MDCKPAGWLGCSRRAALAHAVQPAGRVGGLVCCCSRLAALPPNMFALRRQDFQHIYRNAVRYNTPGNGVHGAPCASLGHSHCGLSVHVQPRGGWLPGSSCWLPACRMGEPLAATPGCWPAGPCCVQHHLQVQPSPSKCRHQTLTCPSACWPVLRISFFAGGPRMFTTNWRRPPSPLLYCRFHRPGQAHAGLLGAADCAAPGRDPGGPGGQMHRWAARAVLCCVLLPEAAVRRAWAARAAWCVVVAQGSSWFCCPSWSAWLPGRAASIWSPGRACPRPGRQRPPATLRHSTPVPQAQSPRCPARPRAQQPAAPCMISPPSTPQHPFALPTATPPQPALATGPGAAAGGPPARHLGHVPAGARLPAAIERRACVAAAAAELGLAEGSHGSCSTGIGPGARHGRRRSSRLVSTCRYPSLNQQHLTCFSTQASE